MRFRIKLILIFITTLLLSGCGFHSHSPKDVPVLLKTLYIDSYNPYNPVTVQVTRMLQGLNIHIVNDPADAPLTLRIRRNIWTPDVPTIIFSGNAHSYSYTLTTKFSLITRDGKYIISPTSVSSASSVLLNSNQVYAPNATALMKSEIVRTISISIFNSLVSPGTKQTLDKLYRRKHHRHAVKP